MGKRTSSGRAQEATEPASNPDMSVTTTQKNSTFQSTPLQDVKKLTDVPGVGPKSAEKLEEANIDSAVKLMGNYLVMGMDEKKMVDWLHDVCELREQEAKKVTEGLAEKATKMVAISGPLLHLDPTGDAAP